MPPYREGLRRAERRGGACHFSCASIDLSVLVSKTGPEGKITYVNDQFVKVSGYSREELLGESHSIVLNSLVG